MLSYDASFHSVTGHRRILYPRTRTRNVEEGDDAQSHVATLFFGGQRPRTSLETV